MSTNLKLVAVAASVIFASPLKLPNKPAALPTQPNGATITLAWEPQGQSTGFKLYASTNKVDWKLVVESGFTNRATLTNQFYPCWYMCRAFNRQDGSADLESDNSNLLGALGYQTRITVRSLVATNANGGWNTLAVVWDKVDDSTPSVFFRHEIERSVTLKTVTE